MSYHLQKLGCYVQLFTCYDVIMKRNLTSALLILVGFSILFANLDIGNSRMILGDWWPLFVIASGGLIWFNNGRKSYLWALLVSLFGFGLLLNTLEIASVDIGDFILPTILVVFGVSLLVRSNVKKQDISDNSEDVTAILAGVTTKNTSKKYTGAKVLAIMGGVEMDLSKATIEESAILDVTVLMGGIELRVPENVIVRNRSLCLLGGIEDKTTPQDVEDAPVLYIDGTISMGGIEIKR